MSLLAASDALNRLYFPAITTEFHIVVPRCAPDEEGEFSENFFGSLRETGEYLLARRTIVMPHQMLQPHPTRQNRTVNNWPTPTTRLTTKAPSRDFIPAVAENRGCPTHRLNRPLQTVPEGRKRRMLINGDKRSRNLRKQTTSNCVLRFTRFFFFFFLQTGL